MTTGTLRQRNLLVCLCLALVTTAVYWPVRQFDFVNFDDPLYVTENQHVQQGMTLRAVGWAMTTPLDQWMPVTWVARITEYQLFGLNPRPHHLVNLLFHVVNTLLLFGVLSRMTGAVWRSAFVAALFALHPLHVESVAWVTGLKDVLSMFFWLLTIWGYVRYTEELTAYGSGFRVHGSEGEARPPDPESLQGKPPIAHVSTVASSAKAERSTLRQAQGRSPIALYALTLCFFALGLMSKPMVVTLPFVLLLLDYWPLGRTPWGREVSGKSKETRVSRLLLEKIPFFALAAASCAVTLWAQRNAVSALERLPVGPRVANVVVSYVRYLGKTFWPSGLSAFYPYQGWPSWVVLGAGVILVAISWGVLRKVRSRPYLVVGWLWYLGTLLPVIGLLQVGEQSMADRYSYLPLIGLFLMVAWSVPSSAMEERVRRSVAAVIAVASLGLCAVLCRIQIDYWRDSETLFRHALEVTEANWIAHNNLGTALLHEDRAPEALEHLERVLQIKPHYAEAHYNLGLVLWRVGRRQEAVEQWEQTLQINPDIADAHNKLGLASLEAGKLPEAVGHFEEAIRLNPDAAEFHYNLGNAMRLAGNIQKAIGQYEQALHLNPNLVDAHNNLGIVLIQTGRVPEAIEQFDATLQLKPDFTDAHYNIGLALEQAGRVPEAIAHYQQALHINPSFAEAKDRLERLRAGR